MNEKKWSSSISPMPMLEHIRYGVSARKLRLFAVACCRRVWKNISDDEVGRGKAFLALAGAEDFSTRVTPDCGRRACDAAELAADNEIRDEELSEAHEAAHELTFAGEYYASTKPTVIGAGDTDWALMAVGSAADAAASASSYVEALEWAAHHSALTVETVSKPL